MAIPHAWSFGGRGRRVSIRSSLVAAALLLVAAGCAPAWAGQGPERRAPRPPKIIFRTLLENAVEMPEPEYPEAAREGAVKGFVEVRIVISAEGRVTEAEAVAGPEPLRAAAVKAAEGWAFKPITVRGSAADVSGALVFKFDPEASPAAFAVHPTTGRALAAAPTEEAPSEAPEDEPGGDVSGVPAGEPGESPPPPPTEEPAPAPDGSKVVRLSGGVLAGKAVQRVDAEYPQTAKAAGVQGAVVVEVMVDESGYVVAARAVSGHPLLRDAAVQAAREWQFAQTLVEGVPVRVVGTLTFNFVAPKKDGQ